jgi:hypothetical protein
MRMTFNAQRKVTKGSDDIPSVATNTPIEGNIFEIAKRSPARDSVVDSSTHKVIAEGKGNAIQDAHGCRSRNALHPTVKG